MIEECNLTRKAEHLGFEVKETETMSKDAGKPRARAMIILKEVSCADRVAASYLF